MTTRVHDVNSGEWRVTAGPVFRKGGPVVRAYAPVTRADSPRSRPVPWPWVNPQAPSATGRSVRTALYPLAPVPGVIPGTWIALVTAGMLLGLWVQSLILARAYPEMRLSLALTVAALVAGFIGAKLWYVAVHRGRRYVGWCIQGFVLGITAAAALGLVAAQVPVGAYLDTAAPALFLGMAVGRLGCFVAGCCGGRPSASRFALWASDLRVGARRIPTQLLESLAAVAIGLVGLLVVLQPRSGHAGAVFIGSLAAYTLCRQILRPFRAEPRRSPIVGPLTAITSAAVLVAALLWSVLP